MLFFSLRPGPGYYYFLITQVRNTGDLRENTNKGGRRERRVNYWTFPDQNGILDRYALYTKHNTLTIHSKHATCHKSLNSQYRYLHCCLYTDRRCLSFIRLRPSHSLPFLNNQTCCLDTLVTKDVLTVSSCTRHKANMTAMFTKKCGGSYT